MRIRIRLVVRGIWAASREELTRYGSDPVEAYERLVEAEALRPRSMLDELSEFVKAGALQPITVNMLAAEDIDA